jgi:hypothetical protein
MTSGQRLVSLCFATTMALGDMTAQAAAPMPATMEEMWKIIQQQQKEIEALKAKAAQSEALQEEVKTLKQNAQQEETKASVQSAQANEVPPSPGKGKAAKSEAERKTDILASEVEKLKTALVIPESREYKSMYGLGPAASQVYRVNRGLSLGGYGEAFYTNFVNDKSDDQSDLQRVVLYAGYKFNDWIVLNNEIEFEHGTTGSGDDDKGEVSVEFSQLDFFLHPAANIRAGLMLTPMGFINEMHEPVTFHGNRRPDVERFIIPSTWRELGAGLFGEIIPGLQYRMYAINGLNAEKYESQGIRDGRQSGSRALAENWAFTGRLDYTPDFARGLQVGASAFLGDAGQDQVFAGQKADVFTQLYEGHVQWHYRGFEFRALGAWGHVGDAGLVSQQNLIDGDDPDDAVVGSENYGWYTEAAYDIMPLLWKDSSQYLAPFVRYERYDSIAEAPKGFADNLSFDRRIYQGGLTYKPIPNIVIKADYRNISSAAGQRPHEFNLGLGFIY